MAEKLEFYRCAICGNIVQIFNGGAGMLVCCGEEMKLLPIQHDTTEFGEKHSPKVDERDSKRFVNVNNHPMTNEHYVQFIQIVSEDKNELYTKFFFPEQIPEIEVTHFPENLSAVEYCNIHNLWGWIESK